ncbi:MULTISPECIES: LD-carboxypeptidase [Catenuloplanes]|uniref:Muramoyltetrapeptide carboxypeptidase LdcA involved in peptidoglycan recycling n=1 Tax=Catenuloplanes niger TaxID=587534 RepID=A0AAE4CYT3_9ACTN|nr:LD-carboxypeptidase [Catenuloplanes niger]MDR7327928.1 muramoyltetrapeptide carboxypeptidase LdcA involved in peptidoglycan recycling [Catenuloplanes niger]
MRIRPGARVAVLSPSFAAPGVFPHVHERAMRVLRDRLGLIPVEYPTTRRTGASAAARAADLTAAWTDPSIAAIMATIGGNDQITVLPHLDPAVFTSVPPTPFAGFSDNTNLLNWLWYHDIPALHGGSTQVHLARPGGPHPVSLGSLTHALFHGGDLEIAPVDTFAEDELDWAGPAPADGPAPTLPAPEWTWHRPDRVVTGRLWGGNLEILAWTLAVSRFVKPASAYDGCVLLVETSQETPSATEVFRTLRNMGERGLLARFPAIIVGLAKATSLSHPRPPAVRDTYRREQREAVLQAVGTYAPDACVVFDVPVGHTDPQYVLPYGGPVTVDGPGRRLIAHF